jgi:predicted RNase H-like HicB family nuclease/DNA-binding XRE family transcriptional regulator
MIHYLAKIEKQSDGNYLVEFPELEGCLTEGKNLQSALENAKEALDGYLASQCDRNLNLPKPKAHKGKHFHAIPVDLRVAFAIHLRQLRMKKGLTQGEVAKKLGVSQQSYAKLETPNCNPSLDTIKRLSDALDVEIDLKLVS